MSVLGLKFNKAFLPVKSMLELHQAIFLLSIMHTSVVMRVL